jgi:alkylated DNA nucleotide flippase Atl1
VTDELTDPYAAYGLALPDYAEEVLDVVDAIPEGQVLTYGDIAELVGRGGPRQVGSVMSHYGSATTWWRVIRADGRPPACHEGEAHQHYREEGTPLRGERVDLRRARWDGPVERPTHPG